MRFKVTRQLQRLADLATKHWHAPSFRFDCVQFRRRAGVTTATATDGKIMGVVPLPAIVGDAEDATCLVKSALFSEDHSDRVLNCADDHRGELVGESSVVNGFAFPAFHAAAPTPAKLAAEAPLAITIYAIALERLADAITDGPEPAKVTLYIRRSRDPIVVVGNAGVGVIRPCDTTHDYAVMHERCFGPETVRPVAQAKDIDSQAAPAASNQASTSNDAKQSTVSAADKMVNAINHTLIRCQADPDFRWLMMGTETRRRLVDAIAAFRGVDRELLDTETSADLQPAHRTRMAELPFRRKQIEDIRQVIECRDRHWNPEVAFAAMEKILARSEYIAPQPTVGEQAAAAQQAVSS